MASPVASRSGTRLLLMGNEAIARGAIEAGLEVGVAYPGTPSSEVAEALYATKDSFNHYVEWSTNEKIAFEVAAGASIVGARSLVAMKNAGLNVAMDTFVTLPYTGVRGGMLVVVADDPGAHYSSTEQDTRHLARYAEIPCLEPQDQQEALDMAKAAFELSETLELPVFLRSVTRVSHASGDVLLGEVSPKPRKIGFNRHYKLAYRWNVYGGDGATAKHRWLQGSAPAQAGMSDESPFNRLEIAREGAVGIVACGIGAAYVADALEEMGLWGEVNFLKVGFVHPVPEKKIRTLIDASSKVLVIEEGAPFVEDRVIEIARGAADKGYRILGRFDVLPTAGEINCDLVGRAIRTALGMREPQLPSEGVAEAKKIVIARSSTLCAGCPHLGSYWSVKTALRRLPGVHIVNGDIGCYEQGGYGISSRKLDIDDSISKKTAIKTPYETLDTLYAMGTGIGMAQGQVAAGYKDGKVLAVCGDSTFFHATLPSVANAVLQNSNITFLVLDNSWTAMTGHQPSPRTGVDQVGSKMPTLDIAAVGQALGMTRLFQASAFDVKAASRAISDAIAVEGLAMVVLTGECALQMVRRTRKSDSHTRVLPEKCTGCRTCLEIGCPAVMYDNARRKASIDEAACVDCGICAQVCPVGAIKGSEGDDDVR